MGDPAGIGPDIALMAWADRARLRLPPFAVFGDPGMLRERADHLGLPPELATVSDFGAAAKVFMRALPVIPVGMAGSGKDTAVIAAIEQAAAAVIRGEALALVTNPIAKKTLQQANRRYPGHTEFLAALAEKHNVGRIYQPVMLLASDLLKVVPVTVHVPLAAVPKLLTLQLLLDTIRITAAALERDFGTARPRIAVAGLNPHAGEGGLMGGEEQSIIAPAIAALTAEGLIVTGPHSADTLFRAEMRTTYDVAIAMYHDQALIPLKTLAFDHGVNVTLGLPFVRTSPDHGTAFDIAGSGKARPDSFIAALRLAAELGSRRVQAPAPA
jgi:4-hydroxythreonine-4-phosphate dehydrogenase